jgi:hypothetical protein
MWFFSASWRVYPEIRKLPATRLVRKNDPQLNFHLAEYGHFFMPTGNFSVF